ncbi:sigma 54-interacting transcriptional regulator [Marinomonas aquiplantarum]|uniref:Sigma-54 interacting transcriptional regulator n=1 Tax=Marinomonas aquiplantarum TaxID=491951 RepID=A0A366CY53_9GAMM|nr:sigma-54 dependent transcriptional regulator [Marinomonas aquiplantarum]RBO81918.1 sigma-54 interacting transcriptional regulator [Marinomonas aquiplantarum]
MNIIDCNIIGNSDVIKQLRNTIKMMSRYPTTVLITGETGTGKELVARGLHYGGELSNQPFVAINCSTFSDELFASELFGYKKGAFTDAKSDKDGLLKSIRNGTIFLDEIDSLSLKSQAALLRVLQESEYRPIGSNQVIKTNARFIAASNCSLEDKIATHSFRQDLFFRLYILSIKVPSLRERKEDITPLTRFFIDKLNHQYGLNKKGISQNLLHSFMEYEWPGNVRELENAIHRYYLMISGEWLDVSDEIEAPLGSGLVEQPSPFTNENLYTSPPMETSSEALSSLCNNSIKEALNVDFDDLKTGEGLSFTSAKRRAIETFEAKFVSRLLHITDGNVTKAASLCGKERRAFGKLVKKYQIKKIDVNLY